jgi:DNA-binding winged helix-turn-helix (wHTH) protein
VARRAVEEGNLTKGVFSLRQALEGDGPTRYIETVPKRRCRFTAEVTIAKEEAVARHLHRQLARQPRRKTRLR